MVEAAGNRPIGLRMRPDLHVSEQQFRGVRHWVLKDPLSLNYFKLRDEEYSLLRMLNGRISWNEIKQGFEQKYPASRLSMQRLQTLLADLHREGLLLAETGGQGEVLLERHQGNRRRKRSEAVTNLLAIRLRGIDPKPLLDVLYPMCRWMFSRWFGVCCGLLVAAAVTLVLVRFQEVRSGLPEIAQWLQPQNLILVALALSLSKILHELGHALTCRHFGGECRELGLLFLVFTPCLYCDVSDAWIFNDKWRRIAVSAAGILVEVVLASLCVLLWYFSQPGLTRLFFLNMVLVCGVSTLAFNGNPLLRYDGYYMLADYLEIPNLWSESRGVFNRLAGTLFLGIEAPRETEHDARQQGLLTGYAAASLVYRWLMVLTILLVVHGFFKSHDLESLGWGLTGLIALGVLSPLGLRWHRFLRRRANRDGMNRGRAALSATAMIAVASALWFVPLPHHVTAPVAIEARDAARIYVSVPGTLRESIRAGQTVQAGQLLAQLENPEMAREVARLTGEQRQREIQLRSLETLQGVDPQASSAIPAARESLADLRDRVRQLSADVDRLRVTAPHAGVVVAPPSRPESREPGRLSPWSGTPLAEENVGAHLETGTLVCLLGDRHKREAVLVIGQQDVEFVVPGHEVKIQLDGRPGQILAGRITQIAKLERKWDRRTESLTDSHSAPESSPGNGLEDTVYQARVRIAGDAPRTLIGARGRAKISVASTSLGQRAYRALRRTFAFQL